MYDITRFNNNYMSVRRVLYYLLAVDSVWLKTIKNIKLSTISNGQTAISMSPSLKEIYKIVKNKNNFI